MPNNQHNHITYPDIKRYIAFDMYDFSAENVQFIERFDELIETCNECAGRLNTVMRVSWLTGIDFNEKDLSQTAKDAAVKIVEDITAELKKAGSTIKGFLNQQMANLEMNRHLSARDLMGAAARGAVVAGVAATADAENIKDNEIIILAKDRDGAFVEFELEQEMVITVLVEGENPEKYRLCISCSDTLDFFGMYDLKASKKEGHMTARTGLVKRGRYLAAIVEIAKDE